MTAAQPQTPTPTNALHPHPFAPPAKKKLIPITAAAKLSHPPYAHVTLAGCLGGLTADFLLHSLDTVKTRLQAPKHKRFNNLFHAYRTILREEGLRRGLYAGLSPALAGALPGTSSYFFIYEVTKRHLTGVDGNFGRVCPDAVAHLIGGSVGDIVSSVLYVPAEVVKVRMQSREYNYTSMRTAVEHIVKSDGPGALYHGYRATLLRDVPFSAIQFALYEKLKKLSIHLTESLTPTQDLLRELAIGAIAGGTAGAVTTPLDVVKTKLQVQQNSQKSIPSIPSGVNDAHPVGVVDCLKAQIRQYGWGGIWRGLAPRVAWTGFQSAGMFLVYEQILSYLRENEVR